MSCDPDNLETNTNPESPRLKDDKLLAFLRTKVSWQQVGLACPIGIGLLSVLDLVSSSKSGLTSVSVKSAIELSLDSVSGLGPGFTSKIRNLPLPRPTQTSFLLGNTEVILVLLRWEI